MTPKSTRRSQISNHLEPVVNNKKMSRSTEKSQDQEYRQKFCPENSPNYTTKIKGRQSKYLLSPVDLKSSHLQNLRQNLIKFNQKTAFLQDTIKKHYHFNFLLIFFNFISFFGQYEGWSVIFISLLYFRQYQSVIIGSYTLFITFLVVNILKSLFCIPRPSRRKGTVLETAYDWSFPSNHVAAAMAVSLAMLKYGINFYGIERPSEDYFYFYCTFSYIFLVCLARFYLMMHHLSDILFSCFIAYLRGLGDFIKF